MCSNDCPRWGFPPRRKQEENQKWDQPHLGNSPMAMWPHGTCQRLREKNTMSLGHFSRIPAVYWSFRKGSQLALSCDPCDWSLWIFCSVAASMTEVKLEIDMALSENLVPHSIGWLIIILPTKSDFVGIPINSQTDPRSSTSWKIPWDPIKSHEVPIVHASISINTALSYIFSTSWPSNNSSLSASTPAATSCAS